MDCTTHASVLVPATRIVSVLNNQSTFHLTTSGRRLFDCSSDQSIPITTTQNAIVPIAVRPPLMVAASTDDYVFVEDAHAIKEEENNKENSMNEECHSLSSSPDSTEVKEKVSFLSTYSSKLTLYFLTAQIN